MTKFLTLAGVFAVAASLAQSAPVQASETGVAGIHSWVRVGGKTCLVDHYHDGSGTGATKGAAQAAAIRSWVDFTAWEYGSSWGRYGLAVGKSMNCDRGTSGWSCNTSARACRGW
jgi:hypothetical protein